MPIEFNTDAALIDLVWRRALSGLERSIVEVAGRRVLTVGPGYPGIWLEHATLEGLLYADIDPAVALANHTIFLDEQKPDGQVPCYHLIEHNGYRKDVPPIGFGQVQSVVSLTLTGYELAQRTGDLAFAARLLECGQRTDAASFPAGWLRRVYEAAGSPAALHIRAERLDSEEIVARLFGTAG